MCYQRIPTDIRISVAHRDQAQCALCGNRKGLEYDHKIPRRQFDKNSGSCHGRCNEEDNIQLLCEGCHQEKTKKDAGIPLSVLREPVNLNVVLTVLKGQEPQWLYLEIANRIAGEIQNGNLKQGTRLPSERRLGEELGVSYMTIRRAMGDLRNRDLIITAHGRGNFVL